MIHIVGIHVREAHDAEACDALKIAK
jgi:hypothetical protein